MPFTVTRQLQWPEGSPVVEVSAGGLDYTNPDALVACYCGEFETYDDPREAVATAIAICKAWRQDGGKHACIGTGATGGMTMPFEPCTLREAKEWAEKRYREMPKCARCGEILPERYYYDPDDPEDKFCSEFCAEEAMAEIGEMMMRDDEELRKLGLT